jgi:hypothetical protein
MDQRKYLTFLLVSIAIINLSISQSLAGAWIVEQGHYKYSTSLLMADSKSRKIQNTKQIIINELLQERHKLIKYKNRIIEKNLAQNRKQFSNTDQLMLKQIDSDVKHIDQEIKALAAESLNKLSSFSLEYGIGEYNSFSISGLYSKKHILEKTTTSKVVNLTYNHNLLQYNNWFVTFSPQLRFDDFMHVGASVNLGYSSKSNKNTETFNELSCYFMSGMSKKIRGQINTYGIAIQEGVKFNNGIIFSNFFALEIDKNYHVSKDYRYFEQISIAKLINFANLPPDSSAIQLGYFWQGSFKDRYSLITGPIISLWTTL